MKFSFAIGKAKWKIDQRKMFILIKYWINKLFDVIKKKARWRRLVLFTFLSFHLNWIFLTKTPSRNSTNWIKQICRWWFRFSLQLLMKFTPSKGKLVEAFPCVLLIRTNKEIYSTNFIPAINEFDYLEKWREVLFWFWSAKGVF